VISIVCVSQRPKESASLSILSVQVGWVVVYVGVEGTKPRFLLSTRRREQSGEVGESFVNVGWVHSSRVGEVLLDSGADG
jgi:hypothetical protein